MAEETVKRAAAGCYIRPRPVGFSFSSIFQPLEDTAVADELEGEHVVFEEAMSPSELKSRHFASANVMYSRTTEGRARKGT